MLTTMPLSCQLSEIPRRPRLQIDVRPFNISQTRLSGRRGQHAQSGLYPCVMSVVEEESNRMICQVLLAFSPPSSGLSRVAPSHRFPTSPHHVLFFTPNSTLAYLNENGAVTGTAVRFPLSILPPCAPDSAIAFLEPKDQRTTVVVPIADDAVRAQLAVSSLEIQGLCPFSGRLLIRVLSQGKERRTSQSEFIVTELVDQYQA